MTEQILKKYWGHDSFRPMQKEIIESVLAGHDTLGILPTGGGKSITFQVPGMMMEGVVIVVTPLISLMKDQVDNLRQRRIKAVYLHSGMTMRERNVARDRIFNDKAKFLYVSPERLTGDRFINEIRSLKVNLIVIDEAHCISQWGYDFRPSYLKVRKLRKVFPKATILALTASATREVGDDICRQLEFRPGANVFRNSILRENLSYVVRESESKLSDILHILNSTPGSAIVYVRSRKRTREIAEYLINFGISASFYHAGLDSSEKEDRQNSWKADGVRVMVATNAFGMGIDKGDVRVVIHYDMPPSLEEYYQEAGRAGRDGLQAYAILLIAKSDKAVLRRRLTMEFPPKEVIKRIYSRLCVFSHLAVGEGYEKTVDFDLAKFCNTFNVEEAVVRPALRILGQAGYVEFIEEFENSARLMVTVSRDELYEIKLSTPIHEKILTAILRTYPGIFTDYVFLNEKKIAYITKEDPQTIYEKLVEMGRMKVIHYIPRRKTPLLYFPTSMEEERYVEIGKKVYEDRKEVLGKRIEAMIAYGFDTEGCRVEKMMRYFGEDDGEDCGHCDNCRKRRKKNDDPKELEKKIAFHLKHLFDTPEKSYTDKEIERIFGRHSEQAFEMMRRLSGDGILKRHNSEWRLGG